MMIKFTCLYTFFFIFYTAAWSQKTAPIQTDRPDQTETAFTVPKHHFQMESGFSMERTDANTRTYLHPSSLWKFGLSATFEVGVITELATIAKGSGYHSGLNPVTLRFKQQVTEEHGIIPKTSFIGYLTLPFVASEALKATYYAPAFRFSMQHNLSKKFTLGYNLGAEWDGESAGPIFIYTLTTGYAVTEKLSSFIECYGFAPQQSKADHRIDAGFNYLLQNNISIDISGGAGLTKNAPEYFAALGFSFRLKD